MKHLTEYLWFNTKARHDLVNITDTIEDLVTRSGIQEGLCLVSAVHITASICVNDDEEGLWQDFWELLERLTPSGKDYKHHLTGEDNGDAHLKRTLVGHQAVLPVTPSCRDSSAADGGFTIDGPSSEIVSLAVDPPSAVVDVTNGSSAPVQFDAVATYKGGSTGKVTATWSFTGFVFAMQQTAVNPPDTAAIVPVAIVSLCSNPGSRRWT